MAEKIDPQLLEQLMHDHSAAQELFAEQWTMVPEDCVQEDTLAWLYRVVRN